MNARPRLSRTIPYWGLIIGSAASIGLGTWLTLDKIGVMSTMLLDGTATGVEVYAGQAWVVFAAAFVVAGLIGLAGALAIAVARSLIARPIEIVEAISWDEEPELDDEPLDDAEPENATEADTVSVTDESAERKDDVELSPTRP